MMQLVLDPFVLMALIWGVAEKDMEEGYIEVFFLSLTIGFFWAAVVSLTFPVLGGMSVVPCLCLTVIILMDMCHTTLQQSVVVAALFGAWRFVFDFFNSSLLGS